MGYFDYSREPQSDIAFVDMKSFYASVECVERGLHPLKTSLCVMSRAENANGLILASSPIFNDLQHIYPLRHVGGHRSNYEEILLRGEKGQHAAPRCPRAFYGYMVVL